MDAESAREWRRTHPLSTVLYDLESITSSSQLTGAQFRRIINQRIIPRLRAIQHHVGDVELDYQPLQDEEYAEIGGRPKGV